MCEFMRARARGGLPLLCKSHPSYPFLHATAYTNSLLQGFGGGHVFQGNVVWNMVRETGDHGPLNSWDRQVCFDTYHPAHQKHHDTPKQTLTQILPPTP